MKLGAYDYLPKPFDIDELRVASARVDGSRSGGATSARTASGDARRRRDRRPIPAMRRVFKLVGRVAAPTRRCCCSRRDRHRQGARRARDPRLQPARRAGRSSRSTAPRCPSRCSKPSCSATRRARSPARSHARAGPLRGRATAARCSSTRSASSPPAMQAKLLRVLQEREFERVGRQRAGHGRRAHRRRHQPRPGARDVATGRFREDLYYRLNVVAIDAAAAARAARGHPAAGRRTSWPASTRRDGRRDLDLARGAEALTAHLARQRARAGELPGKGRWQSQAVA